MSFSATLILSAVLAGLTACSTDPATPTPTPTPASAPATGAPAPAATTAATTASAEPAAAACPPDVAALQQASGLTTGYRINPEHIGCAQRWATARVIADDPAKQGDGAILFEYTSGTWKKIDEGSALECTKYGIPTTIGDQVGCHD